MKTVLGVLLGLFLSSPLTAQTAAPAPPKDLSTWLRNSYANNHKFLARAAEKMPEEFYGLRPGPQPEVRTFGQQVGHLANYNYLWCSQSKGKKNPNAGTDLTKLSTKAEVIKALTDAVAYCGGAYSALTDASGAEMIDITQENGRTT